jgi:periplasmic divalent cation tolerance protein
MQSDTLLVMTTCPDAEHAETLAVHLIEAQLAACINQLPGIRSVYRWEGELKSGSEVMLMIKTPAAKWPALEAAIKAKHPYELPEIIAVPISEGHQPYLDWIRATTE